MDGLSPNQLTGVHMNDTSVVGDLLTLHILVHDKDILDGDIIGELVSLSVESAKIQKYCATTKIQRP